MNPAIDRAKKLWEGIPNHRFEAYMCCQHHRALCTKTSDTLRVAIRLAEAMVLHDCWGDCPYCPALDALCSLRRRHERP